jgi:hypothetical protein
MVRLLALLGLLGIVVLSVHPARADDDEKEKKGSGALARNPEVVFKKMDANGDGKVSKEEFTDFFSKLGQGKLKDRPRLLERMFDKADTNGDGYLSLEEFKKFLTTIRERIAEKKKDK